ncbi:MAG: hypothetical protein E7012_04630 [Alphaproteobacteria bacterium]|nr:hypothetical protein [Alphaproteobacteria bacterium]
MKKLMLLSVLVLTACATVKPVYVRDGVQVYKSTCNGMIRDISDCYALASEQCAGSFEVVNTVENTYDNMFDDNTEVKTTRYSGNTKTTYTEKGGSSFIKTPMVNRSLFFYCK